MRPHGEEGIESPGGQDDSGDSRGEREQRAFCKQLPDEPPASGAERASNRHLTAARGGAGQQQVGPVGAGDQQHQGDGTPQY